ncbi:MAG: hypothetical protein JXR60_05960, partial [Bacteroidales bacterium]|nr:hypothetical protein [Bacteroidales bacterium]
LQDEIYEAIEDGILSGVGNVVLGGCQIAPSLPGYYSISSGIMLIDDKVCFYEGEAIAELPAYFKLEILETDNKLYADGNSKPTEVWYRAKRFTSNQGGQQVIITTTGSPRLKIPYTTEDGSLYGIPKSDAIDSNSSKYLATSKAVNDARLSAIAASTLKYIKENFDSGEINQNLIPVGQVWLGKDGKLRISSTTLQFLGAMDVQGNITSANDINGVDLNAGNDVNADVDLNAGNDVNANGDANIGGSAFISENAEVDNDISAGNDIEAVRDVTAGRNVNFSGKAVGANAPKHLWYIDFSSISQSILQSLGSKPDTGITLSYYELTDTSGVTEVFKACQIDFPSLPDNAIVIVTPSDSSYLSAYVKRSTNQLKVFINKRVEGANNTVFTTGKFSIAIYY